MSLSLAALALLSTQALAAPRWAAVEAQGLAGVFAEHGGLGARLATSAGVPWVIEGRADLAVASIWVGGAPGFALYPRLTAAWPMTFADGRLEIALYGRGGMLGSFGAEESAMLLHRGGGLFVRWGGYRTGDAAFEFGSGILQSTAGNWDGFPIPEFWLGFRTRRGLTLGAEASTAALLVSFGWGIGTRAPAPGA